MRDENEIRKIFAPILKKLEKNINELEIDIQKKKDVK
jgi:hypothetical protein